MKQAVNQVYRYLLLSRFIERGKERSKMGGRDDYLNSERELLAKMYHMVASFLIHPLE